MGILNKPSGDSDVCLLLTATALRYQVLLRIWHKVKGVTWISE